MSKSECDVCGYIYDEEKEGKKKNELPVEWKCPVCESDITYFKSLEETEHPETARTG